MNYIEFKTDESSTTIVRCQEGISDDVKKGFDLVGKALNKRYPFLTGNISTYNNQTNLYSAVPLILEMDFNQFILSMGQQPREYYNTNYGYLSSLVHHNPDIREQANTLQKKITRSLQLFYKSLPEKYQATYQFKFEWSDSFTEPTTIEPYIMHFTNLSTSY